MQPYFVSTIRKTALLLAVIGMSAGSLLACPFCSAPSLTLSEQMEQADAILKVTWESAEKGDAKTAGSTTFKIAKIFKAPEGTLEVGQTIELPAYRAGKQSSQYLLTGTKAATIEWASPVDITDEAFSYIVNAPGPGEPYEKRLAYFVQYLEHEDELIANDAYGEFANAPYEDIAKLGSKIPRDKVKQWIVDPKTTPTRMGLYGLLMGLSGSKEDAPVMLAKINEPTKDFRLGIDGIMSGYLLLAGEEGLTEIEKTKLLPGKEEVTFSETYAAMQALRFLWKYEPGRISEDRLRKSMRLLLDRPDLADLVIADLARWEDWGIVDRLVAMYDDEAYSIPSIKRAIIRYLMVCSAAASEAQVEGQPPKYVATANAALKHIEEVDPKIYRDAKRFFRAK
ncbi:MAG TPA: hypothetical protein VLA12_05765 [Planctomycetaceae bacterium]|nr:hypothetical protein [Planctomycetaceae bacterium]